MRGIAAGLHVLLELPAGGRGGRRRRTCGAAGVRVQGLARLHPRPPRPPALVLGYGLPTVRELREAVAVIADACAAAQAA